MMNRSLVALLLICALFGCAHRTSPQRAIKIDSIAVSAREFETAFNESPLSSRDTPRARKEFLDSFILKKLILKEAEKRGLDKDPAFLNNVEAFWQQSLVKLMLDRKITELSSNITVTDQEIRKYYDAHKDADFKEKDLPAAYGGIKWFIMNRKQKEAVDAWLNSLRKGANVSVDYDLLKIEK